MKKGILITLIVVAVLVLFFGGYYGYKITRPQIENTAIISLDSNSVQKLPNQVQDYAVKSGTIPTLVADVKSVSKIPIVIYEDREGARNVSKIKDIPVTEDKISYPIYEIAECTQGAYILAVYLNDSDCVSTSVRFVITD